MKVCGKNCAALNSLKKNLELRNKFLMKKIKIRCQLMIPGTYDDYSSPAHAGVHE